MDKGKKESAASDRGLVGITPLGKRILVNPFYDADKIGSLYMPDSAKNPLPQSGSVVAVGALADEAAIGDCVLFHPYHTETICWDGYEYLCIDDQFWYGYVAPSRGRDGWKLFARKGHVVVRPTWEPEGAYQEGSIILVTRTFESSPQRYGRVINVGEEVTEWKVGDRILMPPYGGYEIGFVTEPLYILPQDTIPARVCED